MSSYWKHAAGIAISVTCGAGLAPIISGVDVAGIAISMFLGAGYSIAMAFFMRAYGADILEMSSDEDTRSKRYEEKKERTNVHNV